MRYQRTSLVFVSVTVLALSGCSGSTDSPSPSSSTSAGSSAEEWTGQVCTAAGAWTNAIHAAEDTLSDTANLSLDEVRGALSDVGDATDALVTDLGSLSPPQTEAGQQAQQDLTTLSEQLRQQEDVVKKVLNDSSASLPQLLGQVSTVTGAVSTMLNDAETTVDNLRSLDGADELQQAFADAPSCQDLQLGTGS